MAELDYAFLADYAQIEGGKISALGASYTHAIVPSFPTAWITTVAGRIRADESEGPVDLGIKILPPDKSYEIGVSGPIEPGPDVRPYDGKIGLLFTVTAQVPLTSPGLYEVLIFIGGEQVRRLAFNVELASQ
ncbi:hypothetical protein E3O19_01435 [Cryobacterium algoritolerans]|uniref:Uncharacterized protein n=1 Tax=Cryobacterium algoritolerans TaxID=1259184 RepID=A0A4R8WWS9_9MICO|nr:hypothetical protein [Cryobacterium algoritolerans]TFC20061.1 hypothetical protein E3O19_01435 [Cryobacterium algoritolerans]